MSGWIKLYRSIRDHWVFQDESYFRAWCIILMKVNHEPKKVLIHGQLIDCDRGQSILSIQSWVEEFGVNKWSRQKVRTFFKLLEEDEMINLKSLHKTTRLTVCNYEDYQNIQPAANQQPTSSQPADNQQPTTTKEYKEYKETKEPKEKKPAASRSVSKKKSKTDFIDEVIQQFTEAHGDYEVLARGKERTAAGRLVSKYRSKYPGANSQDTIEGLRAYFDRCVNIKDDWYRQNMSLSLMVSKFNEINKILKNGSTGKGKNNSISDDFKRGLLEKMLS